MPHSSEIIRISYSEIQSAQPWIELNPNPREDNECNICGQELKQFKSKDTDAKIYYCPACKTIKQIHEDASIKIMIG